MKATHGKLTTSSLLALSAFISPALHPAPAKAQPARVCASGVELRLSSLQSSQGSLLRVVLRSAPPLREVKGEWAGHAVSFWQDDARGNVYRALLGIDLEQPAGPHHFTVVAQSASGDRVSCSATLSVRKGRFAVERLSVAPEFVEPSPQELERAEKERQRLHAIFAGRDAERMWKGTFRFPLAGPRKGGNFGRRRILNGQPGSSHGGLDIPALTGTPVRAAQRGRVVLAEELFFAGNTVVVDHGLGVYTFYGHLSAIDVKEGDVVEAGELLGRVGATGRVTGPHLHWGLTVNEARVNPLQILPPEPQRK